MLTTMAELSYDDVRKIIGIIDASTLDEIHIELDGFKLEVRRRTSAASSSTLPPAVAPLPAAPASPASVAPSPPASKSEVHPSLKPGQFALTAPMLGTFYRAPAPDAPPFVEVGATVAKDDALCIIEVMKLMNTIKAERPGRVAAVLAENAKMVEFGQALIVFDSL